MAQSDSSWKASERGSITSKEKDGRNWGKPAGPIARRWGLGRQSRNWHVHDLSCFVSVMPAGTVEIIDNSRKPKLVDNAFCAPHLELPLVQLRLLSFVSSFVGQLRAERVSVLPQIAFLLVVYCALSPRHRPIPDPGTSFKFSLKTLKNFEVSVFWAESAARCSDPISACSFLGSTAIQK